MNSFQIAQQARAQRRIKVTCDKLLAGDRLPPPIVAMTLIGMGLRGLVEISDQASAVHYMRFIADALERGEMPSMAARTMGPAAGSA